jgi:hypothetical protein
MRVLDKYFEALRIQDWKSLAACLAEDVERTGPYQDVVRGRQAYVDFLARVIPSLKGYELAVRRVRRLDGGSAVAEISELAEIEGARTETPEVLLFDFDEAGAILRVDIYIKQRPAARRTG